MERHQIHRLWTTERKGFTIIEMIVAMAMAMIVLAAVVTLFSTTNQSYVRQDKMVSAEQNVRSAMEVMSHEIRMAGYIPLAYLPGEPNAINTDVNGEPWSDGNIEQLEEATATSLTFVSDLNSDDIPETVRYTITGTTMTRQQWQWNAGSNRWDELAGTSAGAVTLAEDISSIAFLYTFENGSTGIPSDTDASNQNDREDVRALRIAMTGQTRSEIYAGQLGFKTLTSDIRMRNMGLETRTR